ncbi:MAG: signal peptide peptidase SppA [Muribaculaceae bacterium]|nr:signal peptide peptidase SppA [Muribaculaceae bacterium]
MKKFLLVVCGSFVGVFLALMVFMISSIVFSVALMSMGSKMGTATTAIEKNSILHIDLDGVIDERATGGSMDVMSLMQGNMESSMSLNTLVAAIKNAKDNDKIKGIYLECNGAGAAPATYEALHKALTDFKQCGKFIYAYGYEGYSQGNYYLASVADSMFLNPEGSVDIHGMASAIPYYKKLLDKVGVKMQIIRVGTFKSAVEPYMLENMSEANRLQTTVFMGNIWRAMADSIAAGRKMSAAQLNQYVDSLTMTMPADSLVKYHLVDKLLYADEMESTLKRVSGLKDDEDLRLVTPDMLAPDVEESVSGDRIAVLYACGEIDGATGGLMGSEEGINSEKLSEEIKKLKDDENVKGLVLRVNSPGGSAFGSEQIWHALDDFKKSGKPFAVSMGDYAASGGYYISSGAQRIFAERTTITGSIGIFGMIPAYEDAIKNKLGVNIEVVKTNENADMGVMGKELTPFQLNALQQMVNNGYDLFTRRCADGRHVTQDSIKHIAEGRVWDGVSAKEHGLVDEFGGIKEAVKWVAGKAGLKEGDYKVQNYPALETDWRTLLNGYMAGQYEMRLKGEMGILYEYHKELTRILGRHHVLCLMETVEFM